MIGGYIFTLMSLFWMLKAAPAENPIVFRDNDQGSCESGQVCKSFKECETAITDWKTKRRSPKTCYFKGREQFVCCSEENHSSSHMGSISRKSKNVSYSHSLNQLILYRRVR